MTKAKASQRAKANALKLAKKRAAKAKNPDQQSTPDNFTPNNNTIKGMGTINKGHTFGTARRGSARSK